MEDFFIGMYLSPEVRFKLEIINRFNELIRSFLKKKTTATGVKSLYIGLNCMNPSSLKILKLRKPKYIGTPKIVKVPGYEDKVVEKVIEYEFIANV